jgi:hypothetical protein
MLCLPNRASRIPTPQHFLTPAVQRPLFVRHCKDTPQLSLSNITPFKPLFRFHRIAFIAAQRQGKRPQSEFQCIPSIPIWLELVDILRPSSQHVASEPQSRHKPNVQIRLTRWLHRNRDASVSASGPLKRGTGEGKVAIDRSTDVKLQEAKASLHRQASNSDGEQSQEPKGGVHSATSGLSCTPQPPNSLA